MREQTISFSFIFLIFLILLIISGFIYGIITLTKSMKIDTLQSELLNLNNLYSANVDDAFLKITADPNIGPIDMSYKDTLASISPSSTSDSYFYLNTFTKEPQLTLWKEPIQLDKILVDKNKEATEDQLILTMIQKLDDKIDAIGNNMFSKSDVFALFIQIIFVLSAICGIGTFVITLKRKKK